MSRPLKPIAPGTTPRRAPASEPASARPAIAPTREQIAVRAFEIFIARGALHGRDQEDWFQAENELRLGRQ